MRRSGEAPPWAIAIGAELSSKHWAGHDIKAWAQEDIARLFRISVRTVQRALAWLRDHGWLQVAEPARTGFLALYRLVIPNRTKQGDTGVAPRSTGLLRVDLARARSRTTGPPYPTRQPSPAGPTAPAHTGRQTRRPVNRPWSRPTTPPQPDLFTPDTDRTTASRPAHPVSAML